MKSHSLKGTIAWQNHGPVHTRRIDRGLLIAWVRSCITGTVLAATASAVISLFMTASQDPQRRAGEYSGFTFQLVAIASVLEGALIGYFQWRLLRRLFPTMSGGRWVASTMIAAGSGCLLNWLPTSFVLTSALASSTGNNSVSTAAAIRISIVTGPLIGLIWGVAQYAVLRLHAHHAAAWIVASTIAWTVSFGPLYLSAFASDRAATPLIHILLAAGGGVTLGCFLGLLHGRVVTALRSRLMGRHLAG